ncbi:MAG TPA: glycosyltransferase, partial [Chitinophagaceae bacterium]|nr:glycosyltransferase [Chitinophagaceae bacterium]
SFQTKRFWDIVYKPGRVVEKIWWTAVGYIRRTADLLRAPFYDAVFVNLWVTPLGLPIFERLLFFFNKKVIYDIDDMLFIDKKEQGKVTFIQRLKGRRKPVVLIRHSQYVIVCTPKLEEMALAMNKQKNVVDISSTFDTSRFTPVSKYLKNETTTIGWTGTHSTIPFLESLQPVLAEVSRERKIKLIVIANRQYRMKDVPTVFMPWNEQSEVNDLHLFEIGLYPIPANEWSLGKSSLKALTYMAIGIPFVATAYGTNYRIMQHGVQGFMALTNEEWIDCILKLIDDVDLRRKMGAAGRKTVEDLFSVKANFPKYLEVFETVTSR